MPQHVRNWLEDASGMSEKEGTRDTGAFKKKRQEERQNVYLASI